MIELRDLKLVLDNVVVEDSAEWEVSEESDGLFNGWKLKSNSSRVIVYAKRLMK